jgi:hypothetical protein
MAGRLDLFQALALQQSGGGFAAALTRTQDQVVRLSTAGAPSGGAPGTGQSHPGALDTGQGVLDAVAESR